MTDAEKKRMLAVVRATEFLFSEGLALKTVLLAHHIPMQVWEKEVSRLMDDQELAPLARSKFQHLYDEIERSHDETAAVEALLQALPIAKKPSN